MYASARDRILHAVLRCFMFEAISCYARAGRFRSITRFVELRNSNALHKLLNALVDLELGATVIQSRFAHFCAISSNLNKQYNRYWSTCSAISLAGACVCVKSNTELIQLNFIFITLHFVCKLALCVDASR